MIRECKQPVSTDDRRVLNEPNRVARNALNVGLWNPAGCSQTGHFLRNVLKTRSNHGQSKAYHEGRRCLPNPERAVRSAFAEPQRYQSRRPATRRPLRRRQRRRMYSTRLSGRLRRWVPRSRAGHFYLESLLPSLTANSLFWRAVQSSARPAACSLPF